MSESRKLLQGDLEESFKERVEDLRSRARPKSELYNIEKFYVELVEGHNQVMSVSPSSEIRAGKKLNAYEAGIKSSLMLNVKPLGEEVPIKRLEFLGNSEVRGGDYIEAQIYVGEQPKDIIAALQIGLDFYVERAYKESERAQKIIILSREDGHPVRIDHSA